MVVCNRDEDLIVSKGERKGGIEVSNKEMRGLLMPSRTCFNPPDPRNAKTSRGSMLVLSCLSSDGGQLLA